MDFDDGHGQPADEFDYKDVDFTKPLLDGPTHHGFDEFFGVPGNTEDSLDTEPRIYIRNDKWTFTDRSKMHWMGMKHRAGQILSGPNWNLSQLGPDFLKEGLQFIQVLKNKSRSSYIMFPPQIISRETKAGIMQYQNFWMESLLRERAGIRMEPKEPSVKTW